MDRFHDTISKVRIGLRIARSRSLIWIEAIDLRGLSLPLDPPYDYALISRVISQGLDERISSVVLPWLKDGHDGG